MARGVFFFRFFFSCFSCGFDILFSWRPYTAPSLKACLLLIQKGAPINFGNKSKETPLHKAAMRGSLRSAKLLVNNGADVTKVDAEGKTPREVAKSGNQALIDLLTPEVYLEYDEGEGDGDADEYDE